MNIKQVVRNREIEYRDRRGLDQQVQVDLWLTESEDRAVLVFHALPYAHHRERLNHQAQDAMHVLNRQWLPYLLKPTTEITVMMAHDSGLLDDMEINYNNEKELSHLLDHCAVQHTLRAYQRTYQNGSLQLLALSA